MAKSEVIGNLTGRRVGHSHAVVTTEASTGHIVVIGAGFDEADVRQALELLSATRGLQRDLTNSYADMLLNAMTAAQIPAVPESNVTLAQRRSALRSRLLAGGYFSNKDISVLREINEASARTFVARERDKHRLFTVKHGGRTVVPQMLLDANGELTAVSRAVEVLAPLGLDGWELWSWLASPSGWLSGEVPAAVFTTDPERAMSAVRAYASELAVTTEQ